MAEEWFIGPPCGIDNCPAKRYYILDGLTYCRFDHRSHRSFVTQEEDFDVNVATRKVTKKAREKEVKTAVLGGPQAIEHFLICYQTILARQATHLVTTKNYPLPFETTLLRHLWPRRLQMLQPLLDAAADAIDDDTGDTASKPQQLYSSSHEYSDQQVLEASEGKKLKDLPILEDTLGLLYLSAILCHLPISVRDVYDWITEKNFVYLAAPNNVLPPSMLRRLPRRLKTRLSARIGVPDPGHIHRITLQTATIFQSASPVLRVQIPCLNFRLLLYRYIARLSLPLEVFPAVERLSVLRDCAYTFPTPQKYMHLSEHPELTLVSLIVVATKLLYPFDKFRRSLADPSEPGATAVDWKTWNELYSKNSGGSENADSHLQRENVQRDGSFDPTTVSAKDVLGMAEHKIDEYMKWLQDALITTNEEETSDFQNAVLKLFPLHHRHDNEATGALEPTHRPHDGEEEDDEIPSPRPPDDSRTPNNAGADLTKLKKIQQSLHLRTTSGHDAELELHHNNEEQHQTHHNHHHNHHPPPHRTHHHERDLPKPGDQYKRYRTTEEIPKLARPFFETVARMCRLSVEDLVGVVFRMEERVMEWEGGERVRRGVAGRTKEKKEVEKGSVKGKGEEKAEVRWVNSTSRRDRASSNR
ncbi:MAG: Pol I core factor CF [Alyxoria varia]|nr:MAG: Pol I core factor CF [Alyxoria varia]